MTSEYNKRLWRIWCMLAIVTMCNVTVLVSAQLLLHSGLIVDYWPWQNTHLSLIAVLAAANAAFIIYLTVQRKQIMKMQERLQALEREKNEKISRNAARLYALTSVSRRMCSETDPEKIFKYITDTSKEIFGCDRSSLMLVDPETDELIVRAVSPLSEDSFSGVRRKIGTGIAGHVAKERKPIVLKRGMDLSKYEWLDSDFDNSMSSMVVPIILREELVGVINVTTTNEEIEYSNDDLSALQVFADNAGAFIRHSEQAEWMRKTIEKLRESKAKAADTISRP